MMFNAFVLATITFIGGCVIWSKLPRKVRRWLQKQDLITDVLMLLAAYIVLGGTVTALLAASIVGVMVSACLYVANHEDEFEWLFELIEQAKVTVSEIAGNPSSRAIDTVDHACPQSNK